MRPLLLVLLVGVALVAQPVFATYPQRSDGFDDLIPSEFLEPTNDIVCRVNYERVECPVIYIPEQFCYRPLIRCPEPNPYFGDTP